MTDLLSILQEPLAMFTLRRTSRPDRLTLVPVADHASAGLNGKRLAGP